MPGRCSGQRGGLCKTLPLTEVFFCMVERPRFILMTLTRGGRRHSSCLTKVSLTEVYDFCSKELPTKERDFEVYSLFSHACYGFLKTKKTKKKDKKKISTIFMANSLYIKKFLNAFA